MTDQDRRLDRLERHVIADVEQSAIASEIRAEHAAREQEDEEPDEMPADFQRVRAERDEARAELARKDEWIEEAIAALDHHNSGRTAEDLGEAIKQLHEADAELATLRAKLRRLEGIEDAARAWGIHCKEKHRLEALPNPTPHGSNPPLAKTKHALKAVSLALLAALDGQVVANSTGPTVPPPPAPDFETALLEAAQREAQFYPGADAQSFVDGEWFPRTFTAGYRAGQAAGLPALPSLERLTAELFVAGFPNWDVPSVLKSMNTDAPLWARETAIARRALALLRPDLTPPPAEKGPTP